MRSGKQHGCRWHPSVPASPEWPDATFTFEVLYKSVLAAASKAACVFERWAVGLDARLRELHRREGGRCLLIQAGLPYEFWVFAFVAYCRHWNIGTQKVVW